MLEMEDQIASLQVDFIFAGPLGERTDEAVKLKNRTVEILLDDHNDATEKGPT